MSHVRQEMLTLTERLISPFNGGSMLFLFYWSTILVLFAFVWSDLTNVYWDEAPVLLHLDFSVGPNPNTTTLEPHLNIHSSIVPDTDIS